MAANITEVTDNSVLDQPMDPVTAPVTAPGGITGKGNTVIVENTSDNNLVTFRFKLRNVKMEAAEDAFDAAGHHFAPGAVVVRGARAQVEPELKRLGLSGWAASVPNTVKTHALDLPRIGYVHSWTRTQDEGWWRAALDTYGVPYDYFGEPKLKAGNLRAKYDVIVYPHGGTGLGGGAAAFGQPGGDKPIPYKRTAEFQAIGYPDSTDDIRGGVGAEGM